MVVLIRGLNHSKNAYPAKVILTVSYLLFASVFALKPKLKMLNCHCSIAVIQVNLGVEYIYFFAWEVMMLD